MVEHTNLLKIDPPQLPTNHRWNSPNAPRVGPDHALVGRATALIAFITNTAVRMVQQP